MDKKAWLDKCTYFFKNKRNPSIILCIPLPLKNPHGEPTSVVLLLAVEGIERTQRRNWTYRKVALDGPVPIAVALFPPFAESRGAFGGHEGCEGDGEDNDGE
jgi:hypothetical protein